MPQSEHLLSHSFSPEDITEVVHSISKRIRKEGDKAHVSVQRQLELLDELSQFDLGRFLLQNRGVNGYWTHYLLTYPWFGCKTGKNNQGQPFSHLERFILERAPAICATQQRFAYFLQANQKEVKNNAVLACVPCGMMGELLYLDFTGISSIQLIGIDYDPTALETVQTFAEEKNLSQFANFKQRDAWKLNMRSKFDLISSNGLNVYEPDAEHVIELYRQFYAALKPKGTLVTSFLTYPPGSTQTSEWRMDKMKQEDMLLQRIIFADIINAKWQCFRTSQQTQAQLKKAGFQDIQFIYDAAHIFPTVIAKK